MVHRSLIRARKHYLSDMLRGGAIAVVATAAAWKIRPPRDTQAERAVASEPLHASTHRRQTAAASRFGLHGTAAHRVRPR
jgi:hypothetical protein